MALLVGLAVFVARVAPAVAIDDETASEATLPAEFEELILPGPLPDEAGPSVARRYLGATSTDDLDELIRRRVIRVLVSYDRTNFFVVDGEPRGFEYELLQHYREYLKTRVRPRSWPVTFLYLPMPLDRLLPALVEGRGDVAAAGLTVTPERREIAAFTEPYLRDVREVVVTSAAVTGLDTLDDLAGRQVYVHGRTSFAEHLRDLSTAFEARGLPTIELVEADPKLATEDILDLVNAGVVGITVAEDHIARLWAQVLPDILVREDLVVHSGGEVAWAVRKNNPELLASLNTVVADLAQGTLIGNVLFARYHENHEWLRNPTAPAELDKLGELRPLFETYAERYGFDWRLLAAVAYQESRLDPTAQDPSGAVGLMQVRPETAGDPNVGIDAITDNEGNIHAGTRYLAFLRDTYFADPELDPANRIDFVLAAYNAGPGRIVELRAQAANEGLDPNRWFFDVEQLARRAGNRITAEYVANIHKYYVAYALAEGVATARVTAVEALKEENGEAQASRP